MGKFKEEKIYYSDNETLKKITPYKGALIHGELKVFHKNGQLNRINIFKDGKLIDQKITSYNSSGNKIRETTIKDELYNGPIKSWWSNGKLKSEGTRKNDLNHGLFRFYNHKGELIFENNFTDGIGEKKVYNKEDFEDKNRITYYKGKKYTGILCYTVGGTGQTLDRLFNYNKGKQEGDFLNFSIITGLIEEKGTYVNDVRDGIFKSFNDDGKIVKESHYKKNKFIKAVHYDLNGKLIKGLNWYNGKLQDYNLKIRKFGINGVQSWSPKVLWLEPIPGSIFQHIFIPIVLRRKLKPGLLNTGLYESLSPILKGSKESENILKDISMFNKCFPEECSFIFEDGLEDLDGIAKYKLVLNNIEEFKDVPPSQMFRQEYLRIHKGFNKDYKNWVVIDNSINPAGIAFQADSKSKAESWIKRWEK